MSPSTRAVTTAVLAAATGAAAYVGVDPLVGATAVLVLLLVPGWPRLVESPAPGGVMIVVLAAGFGATAVAWRTQGEPVLRHLPLVLAMSLVLAFFAEMLRRDGRTRLVQSVSGTIAGTCVVVAAAGWIATARSVGGTALVVTAAAAIAVAAVVSALPAARGWAGAGAVAGCAAVAGAGAGALMPQVTPLTGLLAGVVCGLGVGTLRVLFAGLPATAGWRAGLAAATVPVLVGGMLLFAVGRLVLG